MPGRGVVLCREMGGWIREVADVKQLMMRGARGRLVCLVIVWMLGMGGASAQWVDVAVVDDLVDAAHPALAGRVVPSGDGQPLNEDATVSHGTKVASVILRNTGAQVRVAGVKWDVGVYEHWYAARDDCLADQQACGRAREFLHVEMEFYAALWWRFPIVNSSHGLGERQADRAKLEEALARRLLPRSEGADRVMWDRYAQTDRKSEERSVHVRSTGRVRSQAGVAMLNFHRLLVHSNPDLWDHTLFVTALDPSTGVLVDGEQPCGARPEGWDEERHGTHFCVAARGVHCVAGREDGCEEGRGSSYAAPYVAAMLAELHRRCRIGGAALIKTLLGTGDRRPPYDRVERYGAGVVTLEAAPRKCPS